MISVDQIYLLQKKVESAVQKIEQLKSENDALRTKCSELTNALSEKTELLSSFTADEKKIEDGIMNALNRLDSVENSILDKAGQKAATPAPAQSAPVAVSVNAPAPAEKAPAQPVQVTVNVQTAPAANEQSAQEEGGTDLFGETSFEIEGEDGAPADIF